MMPSPTDSPNVVESRRVGMYGKYVSMVSNSKILSYALLPRPWYSYTAQQRLLTIFNILTMLTYLLTILPTCDIPHDAFSYGFTQCRRIPYGKYGKQLSDTFLRTST